MQLILIVGWFLLVTLTIPNPAHAVLPPDLIFSVGSQLVQFFSIGAVVVGGVISTVVVFMRQWLFLSRQNVWALVCVIVLIVVSSIAVVYVTESKKQLQVYQDKIDQLLRENQQLQTELHASVPQEQYETVLASLTEEQTPTNFSELLIELGTNTRGKTFFSDTISLYSDDLAEPFALEVDFNRLEEDGGVFAQYSFIDATWQGNFFNGYDARYATSTKVQPNNFITSFNRKQPADLSTRDTYTVELMLNNKPLRFTITDLQGDFITRDHPAYTRYHSVGTANVSYDGQQFTAHALVEGVHSLDVRKYIFFDAADTVEATTHQFVLWDEQDNFYLIDKSEVHSNTPTYPSHNWLLYKDARSQAMRKSFTSTIEKQSSLFDVQWIIRAPEFDQAIITVQAVATFKNKDDKKIRRLVQGTVTDARGTRGISGILHFVN